MEEVRTPSPRTLEREEGLQDFYRDWMLDREYFHKYSRQYIRPFDLDGASDNDGMTSQVLTNYCCPTRPFQDEDLGKYSRIWLHPPYDELEDFLGHYLRQKLLYPQLRAVIVVPKWTRRPWFRLLRNFRLIDELPAESSVFTCLTGNDKGLQGTRQEVGPTRWPTQVYADNTDYVRFLPQKFRNPQKTYWTHAKIIITDGRRVLLRRENSGWIWFPGGERRTADATPESTNSTGGI